ncbi:MAG: isocitrate dehydrogenase (NADP(+)) [Deltaproteobacteria bacterium]|nr:isocitrate dehydrogenase (NADP(+)) [Deltaproteobacteria bacterium]MBM4296068.1 isocitrate dehydrogenase (NADP(+)) [Deltaproteobacteria bacterium]
MPHHEPEKVTGSAAAGLKVPDRPIVLFIEGDGTGPDIWRAAQPVLDVAVAKAYGGQKGIAWQEILAGEKAFKRTGSYLPVETLTALREYRVALKGPLTTPIGGGFRSLNVTLRQVLDLYACIRPVRYYAGVPSPLKEPEKIDMVVFRENTEDVYAGIEWEAHSPEAQRLVNFLNTELGCRLDPAAAIGIKPMTERCSKRLIRMALKYALDQGRASVTLMHKGNIMKYTEGAFQNWGYEVALEFGDRVVSEAELAARHQGKVPPGKTMLKDRLADNLFQQVLLRPAEYQVIATPNLNGDYISDALAAQVGGLGMAPGANIGDDCAIFEATHGSAPKYAGQDKVNPCSVILSGAMLLEYLGWREAARLIHQALPQTLAQGIATYDLARLLPGAKEVSCSGFGQALIENMG